MKNLRTIGISLLIIAASVVAVGMGSLAFPLGIDNAVIGDATVHDATEDIEDDAEPLATDAFSPAPAGRFRANIPGPIGNGLVVQDHGIDKPNASLGTVGQFVSACDAGGSDAQVCWVTLTQDMIGAAFSVSLAYNSGGGTFELSQSGCNPTYNATPAASSGTIQSGSTWADNQGHSGTTSAANPLANPNGGAYSGLTTAGTITATITETQISPSVTHSASATGCTFYERWFGAALDTHSGGNTFSASGNNASLTGGSASATLPGSLSTVAVGTVIGTVTPSGTQYAYWGLPHASHTYIDANTGFAFSASVVATISFTNQYGQASISMDVWRSDFGLSGATFKIEVAS